MASALPATRSWFPGHMSTFMRQLPALLAQTHVVLEVRDVRLPLTSINPHLEFALDKWKRSRASLSTASVCERIVVYTKRDLIDGGEEDLSRALSKHFDHRTHFNSNGNPKDLKRLHSTLVSIAKSNEEITTTLNVLVVGMPNMGKSTLLNSLRWAGTNNSTKAMRTSALPGLTQKLSERLRLNFTPPIYAVDSPGIMVPFLGRGDEGRERGLKLALIAGIKESLYDDETLAEYLLHKLNGLNPEAPAYLSILPPSTPQQPLTSTEEFLSLLAQRLGAQLKGGEIDTTRTAKWFLRWWREGGAVHSPATNGWGFDFGWEKDAPGTLEEKMERHIGHFVETVVKPSQEEEGVNPGYGTSVTKERKDERQAKKLARDNRRKAAASR